MTGLIAMVIIAQRRIQSCRKIYEEECISPHMFKSVSNVSKLTKNMSILMRDATIMPERNLADKCTALSGSGEALSVGYQNGVQIIYSSVQFYISENLNMRRVSTKCVPKLLSFDQGYKSARIAAASENQ